MVKVGDVYLSPTGRAGEHVVVEAASREKGYVKLVVRQNGKELKTRKSVHVSVLMARTMTQPGFRLRRGWGLKVANA